MSPAPRKKKDEEAEAPETTPAAEADVPVTPEADVASEDIEQVPAEEIAELDAEAAEAEVDAPADGQEEAPKPKRRTRKPKAETAAKAPKAEAEKPAEKPARTAPAPRRRRAQREPGAPIPVVRAQAKYVRSSARKARLVCDHIRGKSVDEARAILAHTPRAVARDWSKLLESAIANAEHNHELVGEDLYVKAVRADEGPTIRRFRPRAMGRATKIRKRTAHLTILLTPKD